jgi:hypothetical protein
MARDLLWVCDELYRLHQDLEEIRRRQAAEQAAATQEAAQLPTADITTGIMASDNGDA